MRIHRSRQCYPIVAVIGGLLAWQVGCSDGGEPVGPDPDPTTGFIQVSTTTSGTDLDPDGYTASMDGNSGRSIGLNGVITFSDVPTGDHQVRLSGLVDNCSIAGNNPVSASVTAGATAQVGFDVTCEALPFGSLEVTTSVTNNFDPDGYDVFVAGVDRGRVDVDGSATFDDLPAGAQDVELRNVAPNCAVDGDNPATVTIPAGGSVGASFSVTCSSPPDGRIIYNSWDGTGNSGFSVVNADGTGAFVLRHWQTVALSVKTASWSPDGSKVALINDLDAPGNLDLYVMNKDGTDLVRLTSSPETDTGPAWSPDGSRIAFTRRDGFATQAEIFVINVDGSGLMQLTDDAQLWSFEPSWSPDGSKIVFGRNDDPGNLSGDARISVMNADGSGITRINEPAPICVQDGFPAWRDDDALWSPDGSRLAFRRGYRCEPENVNNDSDIMMVNPDWTGLVNVTDSPDAERVEGWSPDGAKIVFTLGNNDIYVMNADGTDVTRLPVTGVAPDWGR